MARDRQRSPITPSTCGRFRAPMRPADAAEVGKAIAGISGPTRRLWRVRRRLYGHVQRHHPELLQPTGVYKERLSQSTLYAKMLNHRRRRGPRRLRMARRPRDEVRPRHERGDRPHPQPGFSSSARCTLRPFALPTSSGANTIGIQYQQGSRTRARLRSRRGPAQQCQPAPCVHETTGAELYAGDALPHFNEVDECAGLDGLVTNRIWKKLGYAPENTTARPALGRHYKAQH